MNLERFLYYLRFVAIAFLLPGYLSVFLVYRTVVGMFNTYIRGIELFRPLFGEYVITRRDQFFAHFIFVFTGVGLVAFLKPFHEIYNMLHRSLGVDFGFLNIVWIFLVAWFFKIMYISIFFVFIDELFLKKFLHPNKVAKVTTDSRDLLRDEALSKDMVYAGTSFDGTPLFISNDQRAAHVNIMGTPGTGKSESMILPWAFQDICRGYGSMIVDAKGSMDFYSKLYTLHFQKNPQGENRQKIFLVNLGDPNFSNTYNPVFRGTAVDLKDRIMGAFQWENEYYKRFSESILFSILQACEAAGKKITLEDLHLLFTEEIALRELLKMVPNAYEFSQIKRQLQLRVIDNMRDVLLNCNGLINNIFLMSQGGVNKIINTYNPDVDLLEIYKRNQVVFFSLPTNLRGETSRAFGKMLLMDLKSAAGYIELGYAKKHFFSVFIDEFSEFATPEYMGWLNKSRSSGMAAHMSYQSLGDLSRVDESFPIQMSDNTNLNVIFRVNDPDTAENISKMLGTYTDQKETSVVEKSLLTTKEGLKGSVREVEEFRVDPNILKNELRRGQALIFGKHPFFFYGLYNTDFIPNPDIYEPVQILKDDLVKSRLEERLNIANLFEGYRVSDKIDELREKISQSVQDEVASFQDQNLENVSDDLGNQDHNDVKLSDLYDSKKGFKDNGEHDQNIDKQSVLENNVRVASALNTNKSLDLIHKVSDHDLHDDGFHPKDGSQHLRSDQGNSDLVVSYPDHLVVENDNHSVNHNFDARDLFDKKGKHDEDDI